MTILEAIDARRSRRKYIPELLEAAKAQRLQALAQEYSAAGDVRMELVLNDGTAFNGLRKSYGMFAGVQNYAGLIAGKDDTQAVERLGYCGELLMLHATAMGLGTCWVGGSFDRKDCPFTLSGDEMIVCTITIGRTEEQNSRRERLIYNVTHRKTKPLEKMFCADGPAPEWFMAGMRAVQKAPSAVNKKPVVFSYQNGQVTAAIPDINNTGAVLDMGIAKLHFELGAGGGTWAFGNGAAYTRQD